MWSLFLFFWSFILSLHSFKQITSAALRKNESIGGRLRHSAQSKKQALFLSLINLCSLVKKRQWKGNKKLIRIKSSKCLWVGEPRVPVVPVVWERFPSIYWYTLQQFPRAAIVKDHNLGSLSTETCCLAVMEAGSPKSRCQQVDSIWGCEKESVPCLWLSFWWLLEILDVL